MDFDFDDISSRGSTTKKEPVQKKKPYKMGILLTIPCQEGYLSRDIAECTNTEFVDWMKTVYPLIDEKNIVLSDYARMDIRIKIMNQIEKFYAKGSLFKSNTKNSLPDNH